MSRYTFRPCLDALEAREVPAVSIYTLDNGHTLQIVGSKGWDNVEIVQNDTTNTLEITSSTIAKVSEASASDVDVKTFSSSSIKKIQVDLGVGNDSFTYRLADGTDLVNVKSLTVNMGTGDDTVNINLASPVSTEPLVFNQYELVVCPGVVQDPTGNDGASLVTPVCPSPVQDPTSNDGISLVAPVCPSPVQNITDTTAKDVIATQATEGGVVTHSVITKTFTLKLDTGAGDDKVNIALGEIAPSVAVNVTAALGAGDDSLSLSTDYGIGQNAKLTVNLNGGAGNDSIETSFHGKIAKGAVVDLQQWGGAGDDHLYTGLFDTNAGQFNVMQQGEAGNDDVQFYTGLDAGRNGSVNAKLYGGTGDDNLTFMALGSDNTRAVKVLLAGGTGNNIGKLSRDVALLTISDLTLSVI